MFRPEAAWFNRRLQGKGKWAVCQREHGRSDDPACKPTHAPEVGEESARSQTGTVGQTRILEEGQRYPNQSNLTLLTKKPPRERRPFVINSFKALSAC
jgi:hypothetical protein